MKYSHFRLHALLVNQLNGRRRVRIVIDHSIGRLGHLCNSVIGVLRSLGIDLVFYEI